MSEYRTGVSRKRFGWLWKGKLVKTTIVRVLILLTLPTPPPPSPPPPPPPLYSQIMDSVHSKVYPVVCSKYLKEDKRFAELCRQLRPSFTPSVLNVPSDYHCPYPVTLSDLKKMQRYELPLEKLLCLQDALV